MKALLAVAVVVTTAPAAAATTPRATVVSASRSSTVDITLLGVRAGSRLRDVGLRGDGATAVFVQRLPDLTLVATLVGADGRQAARIGDGPFPNGRYRMTIVTRTPAVVTSPTSRSQAIKAVRPVVTESRVTTSTAIAPATRIVEPVRTRRGSLYAFVLTTAAVGAAGAHLVCVRSDGACLIHGPSSVTTWRTTGAAPSTVRTSLVGVADGSYSSFEGDVVAAGVVTSCDVVAITAHSN